MFARLLADLLGLLGFLTQASRSGQCLTPGERVIHVVCFGVLFGFLGLACVWGQCCEPAGLAMCGQGFFGFSFGFLCFFFFLFCLVSC